MEAKMMSRSLVDVQESFSFHGCTKSKWDGIDCEKKRTLTPITTGTSILGMVFDGGVIIAGDMLGSYGSLARFRNCQRVIKVNENIIFGASGDYADFQFVHSVIEDKVIEEESYHDGFSLKPKSLHCWLTRILYNRRSKFDPLWNTFIVGGIQDGEPFLGQVDKIGTSFETPTVATGFGAYIAQPILRDLYEKKGKVSLHEAKEVIQQCMTILYYRDARAFHKYHLGIVTKDGATVEGPFTLKSDWEIALSIKGYN